MKHHFTKSQKELIKYFVKITDFTISKHETDEASDLIVLKNDELTIELEKMYRNGKPRYRLNISDYIIRDEEDRFTNFSEAFSELKKEI